jgi:glycosyltransferase involved in cell wall biosynthesis
MCLMKKIIKKQLNLPLDKIIIGSFQKDGKGWGDGNEAKLEKGPDFFCDVIEKLSQKYSVHVLLTGPARGYVKKRLEKSGVSFTHRYLKDYKEIVKYYHALDLYLIASRQEGGPKALLECMACKVPFVSTAVGMAPDIIQDNHNGLLVNIEDLTSMVEKASRIIDNKKFADSLVDRSVKDVQYYEWKIIAEKYYDLIYKNIL